MVGNDLAAYYQAVVSFWQGINPYLPSDFWNFIYPPGFLVIFGWLVWVPATYVGFSWLTLSLLCLWYVVGVVVTKRFFLRLVIFCLVLAWFPVRFNILMGQVNLVVLAALVWFFYLLVKKRTLAGVILGLTITVKVSPVLFVFWLVRLRRWREILTCLVTVAGVNGLALIFLPAETISDFMRITSGGLTASSTYYFNQSFVAALTRLLTIEGGAFVARIISGGIFIYTNYVARKIGLASFCLVLVAMTMVSPVTWQHHLVGLIPAILYLFKRGENLVWVVIGTMLSGLNLSNPARYIGLEPIYSHAAIGGLVILILMIRVVVEENRVSGSR